jgi:ligand-binding sensor domain-containing protein/serine phosphatase RsbU (regulator of sigma subunit)
MPLSRQVRRLILSLFLTVPISCIAFAQQEYLFQHLTVKEGLSQGSIMCILQDSRGFMWFGTQDGLNRYDGYEFKVFKHDPTVPTSINGNFILFLAEDTAHALWFGTLENPDVLNRFDLSSESFTQVARDSVNLKGAKIGQSKSSYNDPSGVEWSTNPGGGLLRFDTKTGKRNVYKHIPSDSKSLSDDKVYSVLGDHTGILWISTRGGLDRFDSKSESFIHYRHNENDPHSLTDNYAWPLLEDRSGTLWIGTFTGGLNRYDRTTDSFTHYGHDESNPRSPSSDLIYSLYQDASGMIWIGTGEHGVDHFHPELTNFIHYLHNPKNKNSLSDNNIPAMFVDHSGTVWVGTPNGLNRWDRNTGIFTLYKHEPLNSRSLADDNVQTILEDRSGTLWFGTLSNGLDCFDRATATFKHFKNNPADPNSLSDNRIYALCEDHKGDLWIGTYGGGLCRLDTHTGKVKRYTHSDSLPTSLANQGVISLLEDRQGFLWVGTLTGGLDRFNRETETFTHFSHNDSLPKSISDDIINTLYEDHSGTLWIGTSNGLNRFQSDSSIFHRYREKEGLPNAFINGLEEDDAGNLWMSTNKGISRFDVRQGTFHNYNYNDGLQGDEFNQAACAKDPRTGEMFFGGPNGFNAFYPEKVKDNPYIPPVVFSSFTRYNSDDEEGKPIEEAGIETKSLITLSYKDNVANFKFAALNFYNTFKNRYAYKLEGYSENWIQLGTDRLATFTNLDAGKYLLRVRGSNNNNVWNDNGASLTIIVTPPWWKTTWAYGIYGFLILGFLYSARRIEINRREQKAQIRESELHTKAVEAEKRALQAENDRQTKELDDARNLQLSMLPKEIPKIPGYDISVFMKTATEVGGDYYDFKLNPDGILDVAFGDATGHGMQAGTIVTLMKGLFISDAAKFEIQNFFNHCSRAIKEIKLGRLYMALTLARFHGKNVSLSSAGMPPAYLYRKIDGTIEEILLKAVPLGSMKNFPYSLYETVMETGDTLLFLTDGLPEQKNTVEEMFDYSRIMECFKTTATGSPENIISQLMTEGETWMKGVTQDDDITLLVIKRNA